MLQLSDKIIRDACKYLMMGNYASTVFSYLGIPKATWYKWIKEGKINAEKDESELTERELLTVKFYEETERAKSAAVIKNIAVINKASETNWQCSAWWLERTKPELFSLVQRQVVQEIPNRLSIEEVRKALVENKEIEGESKEIE